MVEGKPTPAVEDLAETKIKLGGWFNKLLQSECRIEAITIPAATGMSNVTLLFTVEWDEDNEVRKNKRFVARLQPKTTNPLFPAYDLEFQYQIMERLDKQSTIPVPRLIGLEKDDSVLGVPFYIMEYQPGRIPTDIPPYHMDGWLKHDADATQRKALWNAATDVLAELHTIDYKKLGLNNLLSPTQTPLEKQLSYWKIYHDWALESAPNSICTKALEWLHTNQPSNEPVALCWGDARISNMIFAESMDKVVAVLDWEMATLGNPIQDIAWFNYMDACFAEGLNCKRLTGFPSYEETLSEWQTKSGHSAKHYNYYTIFAGMRFALILSRILIITNQSTKLENNFACQILKKRMADLIHM